MQYVMEQVTLVVHIRFVQLYVCMYNQAQIIILGYC